jgi:hypothetical protein
MKGKNSGNSRTDYDTEQASCQAILYLMSGWLSSYGQIDNQYASHNCDKTGDEDPGEPF